MSMDFNSTDFQSSPGSMAWLVKWTQRRDSKFHSSRWIQLRTGAAAAALILCAGALTGPMLLGPSKARSTSQEITSEAVRAIPLTVAENAALFNPEITPQAQAAPTETPETSAQAPTPPADGLAIVSQSWRRGGLGSNAQVTFTLRNNNDYAVRDVEIACAFTQRDGSHLTDRIHTISDVINTKSKKTFVRMHVGFVNVFADKVKCSPVAADKL